MTSQLCLPAGHPPSGLTSNSNEVASAGMCQTLLSNAAGYSEDFNSTPLTELVSGHVPLTVIVPFGPGVKTRLDQAAMLHVEAAARAYLIENPHHNSWMQ